MELKTKFIQASLHKTTFCKFRGDGVWCDDLTVCAKCGWNPNVELERIEQIRYDMKRCPPMSNDNVV